MMSLKKKLTEEKAKDIAAVWETYLNVALPFSSKDDLKKCFWKNIHLGRVVVWCGVNQMIIHFSEASILPRVRSSINPFLKIVLVLNL